MTRFDNAFNYLINNEGGYSDDPLDHGGATNYGITQDALSEFNCTHNEGLPDSVKDLNKEQAKVFYQIRYWLPCFEQINDERIAIKIWDHHVNMDNGPMPSKAVKLAQLALNTAVHTGEPPLVVDGIMGPKTIDDINSSSYAWFMSEYKRQLGYFYRGLNQPHFLKGWLARVEKEPK